MLSIAGTGQQLLRLVLRGGGDSDFALEDGAETEQGGEIDRAVVQGTIDGVFGTGGAFGNLRIGEAAGAIGGAEVCHDLTTRVNHQLYTGRPRSSDSPL
jgi:hypothetical protein